MLCDHIAILTGKLLSAAAKAVVPCDSKDGFLWTRCLTASVRPKVAFVVVKWANHLSILWGLPLLAIQGNLCVAVGIWGLGTKLSASFLFGSIPHQDHISTASTSSGRCTSSACSGGWHVKRLPAHVVCGKLVVATREVFMRQLTVLVQHGETTGLTGFGQLSFYLGNLTLQQKHK